MKRIILSILTLCAFIPTYPQSFNGVELSGTRAEFVRKYLNTHPDAEIIWDMPERNSTMIRDFFLDYEVKISIDKIIEDNDNIHSLWFDIVIPSNFSWKDITSCYENILLYFTTQYGAPHPYMQERKFEHPFDNGNHYGKEISALKLEKCRYSDKIFINSKLLLDISIIHTYDSINPNVEYNAITVAILPRPSNF